MSLHSQSDEQLMLNQTMSFERREFVVAVGAVVVVVGGVVFVDVVGC